MEEKTLSKFERSLALLTGGNQLSGKPATIKSVTFAGESETYIVQTIRDEKGDHVVLEVVDRDDGKDRTLRIILPPKVVNTIMRQRDALTRRARVNASKAAIKERMANGWKPNFKPGPRLAEKGEGTA